MNHVRPEPAWKHGTPARTTIVLINLGTPKTPTAAIAAATLALGARQGIFLTSLRVQEYRKIGAYRAITEFQHLFCAGVDHDLVVFGDGMVE